MRCFELLFLLSCWIFVYQSIVASVKTGASQLKVAHTAPISSTRDYKNLRVLYRFYEPSSVDYVLVAGTNHLYQFKADNLQNIVTRVTGPKNFSICCMPGKDVSADECVHSHVKSVQMSFPSDFCGLRETDSVVKAWSTSTVPYFELRNFSDGHSHVSSRSPVAFVNDDRVACENALYVCYNLHHGFCERLRLTNIEETSPWIGGTHTSEITNKIPVAGNDATTSTAIAIGAQFVYIATESDGLQDFTIIKIHPLSARFRDFRFADSKPGHESFLSLTDNPNLPLQYKLAFRYRSYAYVDYDSHIPAPAHIYFILQQPESYHFYRWQPRMARICDDDQHFYSYVELNLACQDCIRSDYEHIAFNALRTAARGKVGQLLSTAMTKLFETTGRKTKLNDITEVVVVAFAAHPVDPLWHRASLGQTFESFGDRAFGPPYPEPSERYGSGAILLNGSAIAIFPMAQINTKFDQVIANCLAGQGVSGPEHFLTQRERDHAHCVPDPSSQQKSKLVYCPTKRATNQFIMGHTHEDTLESPAFLYLPHNVTDVAVTSVSGLFTVAFFTTDDGWLLKYEVTQLYESRRLDAIQLTTGGKPLTSLALDLTGTVAFVTAPNKVIRVELSNCAAYVTCLACLNARDPYCGWCVGEGRCLRRDECSVAGLNRTGRTEETPKRKYCEAVSQAPVLPLPVVSFTWLAYNVAETRCPVIKHISPTGLMHLSKQQTKSSPSVFQRPIVLKLEGDLTNDIRMLMKKQMDVVSRRSVSSRFDLHNGIAFKTNPTNRLHCAFRQAPSGLLYSQNVLSGSVSPSEIHMLLAGISPGPLFVSTVARIETEEENSFEVHCISPALEQLPSIPATQASIPIILWTEWSTDQTTNEVHALAPALFAVYDCAQLSDCRSCAQSRFGCVWCLLDDRCVSVDSTTDGHFPGTLCSTNVGGPVGDSTIYSNPNVIISGQAPNCSSFKSDTKSVTLMNGSALVVKFQVFNVQQPLRHFSCMEGCNGQRVMAVYNAADSTVICRIEKIDLRAQLRAFEERSSSFGELSQPAAVNCSLDLYWHGQDTRSLEGHKMINEDNVQVEVYTCGWLAEYCDMCLSLPERFGCGWCISEPSPRTSHTASEYGELPSNKCTTQSQCITQSTETRRWLQPSSICPDPQIISLFPTNGTLTGQTVLHVEGRNLGRRVEDLSGGVHLDVQRHKLPCTILPGTYNRSRSFDCRLVPVNDILPTVEGRLTVEIDKLRYKASSPMFHFLTPRLNAIYPERGPLAGGTYLRLTGFNLNIGARRSVSLVHIVVRSSDDEPVKSAKTDAEHNVSIPCDIDSETEHLIVCRTRPLPSDWAHLMSPANKRIDKRDLNVGRGLTSVNNKVAERPAASSVDHLSMSVVLWNDMTPTKPSIPYTFFYSPNPSVSAVERQNVLAGGGTSIRVQGEFLFVIESPRLVLYFNWTEFSTPCEYILPGVLECSSPCLVPQLDNTDDTELDYRQHNRSTNAPSSFLAYDDHLTAGNTTIVDHFGSVGPEPRKVVPASLSEETTDWPLRLQFGFILDGVANLRVHGYLTVHSDPVVNPFPDGIRQEELDDFTKPNPPVEHDEPQSSVLSKRNADDHNMLNPVQAGEREGENLPTPSVRVNQLLRLHGQFDALVAAPELAAKDELLVLVGDTHICLVNSVVNTEIRCDLDRSTLIAGLDYPVLVQFGRFLVYRPGVVRFVSMGQVAFRNQLIMIATGIVVLTVLVSLIAFTLWRRFDRRQRTYQAKLDQKYAEHESRVVRVFKEDFMELQTNMLEFSQGVKRHNLPYRDYRTFCLFTLFPEFHCELMVPVDPHTCGSWPSSHPPDWSTTPSSDCASFIPPHPLLSPFTVPAESMDSVSKAISLFHALICNRKFLCLMVHVIEEDERTTAQDKSRLASLLCAALQPKMEHLTRVMCDLISEMLQRLHNQGDNRLPTAFRRAETVVDKLVSNWLSFLLFNFIKNNVGENLFYFYRALLQQLNMGPRDAVTGKARYTLDSSALLLSEMTGQPVMLAVEDPQKLFCLPSDHIIVKVLDCDTISQAKEKILDVIYKNKPYSQQLKPTQLDMTRLNEPAPQFNSLKSTSPTGLILCDWDISLRREGSEKPPFRLNCIRDYGLGDNSRVALIMCQHRRPKTVPTSPASMRSSSICMFKGNTRLPPVHNLISNDSQTCSPEQTVLSDTVPLAGQLDTLEAGQKSNLSQSLPLYPVCSPVKTDGTESANTMYSVYCVRPTGSPDPTIWYHLELSKSVNTEGGPCLGPYANGGRLGSGTGVGGSGLVIHEPPSMSVVDYNSGESPPCTYVGDVCQVHSKCGPVRKSHWRGTWRFIRKDSTQTADHSRPDRLEAVTNAAVSHPLLSAESSCLAGSSTLGLQHNSGCGHICAPPTKHRDRVKRKRKNDSIFSTRGDRIKQTSASLDRLMDSLPKEVFFNRLMVTRLSVTCYMEKLFEVIFSSVLQSHSLPSPIKYLFDFLDAQAASLGVEDPKTVHAWKSNCLQMRFWNQIITNLDYIFDIPLLRHTAFERSFHALSQAMTYACAPTKEKLTPDSSSVKLLFARDISQQWARVNNYYREIKAMPAIKREDMKEILHQHSLVHANDFNVSWAIYELYTKYVKPCHNVLVARLQQEALKAPITYKSQHSFDSKTIPNTPGVSQVDEVEFSDYNPIQLIQVLIEVEQCMDSAQSSTLPVRNAHSMNRPRQPGDICPPIPSCQTSVHPGGQSPCFFTSGPASPSAFLSTVASGGDTTDYPDTLRSLNTLTTEFAGDDTSRLQPAAQHIHHYHHCYHLYNPDGSTVGGHPASEPRSPSLEATVHRNRYAPTDPVV